MRLHRKTPLALATLTLTWGAAVVTATPASAGSPVNQYTATVTSTKAPVRWCASQDCSVQYHLYKGEKEVLDCQLTNSAGNIWYKTNVKALAGKQLSVYSGHFSSAYKNFLRKC